jgi:hypothetical protein
VSGAGEDVFLKAEHIIEYIFEEGKKNLRGR